MAGDDPAVQAGVAAGQQASALGKSQQQAKTAVGMGYDAGQAGLWVPSGAPWGTSANTLLVANRGFAVRFVAPKSIAISKIALGVAVAATADDPGDVGLYDANLNRLSSSGPTTGKLNGSGTKIYNLTVPVSLLAGTVYYAAQACGPVGGTAAQLCFVASNAFLVPLFGALAPQMEGSWNAAAYPLPASFVTSGGTGTFPVFALMQ